MIQTSRVGVGYRDPVEREREDPLAGRHLYDDRGGRAGLGHLLEGGEAAVRAQRAAGHPDRPIREGCCGAGDQVNRLDRHLAAVRPSAAAQSPGLVYRAPYEQPAPGDGRHAPAAWTDVDHPLELAALRVPDRDAQGNPARPRAPAEVIPPVQAGDDLGAIGREPRRPDEALDASAARAMRPGPQDGAGRRIGDLEAGRWVGAPDRSLETPPDATDACPRGRAAPTAPVGPGPAIGSGR